MSLQLPRDSVPAACHGLLSNLSLCSCKVRSSGCCGSRANSRPGCRRRNHYRHHLPMRRRPSKQVQSNVHPQVLRSFTLQLARNRHAARHLAKRCERLRSALKQYDKKPLPDRIVQYWTDMVESVVELSLIHESH
jgi:hypothetical protein